MSKERQAERELAYQHMTANAMLARGRREAATIERAWLGPTMETLAETLAMFAPLLDRVIGCDRRDRDRQVVIIQRCRACRGDIVSPLTNSFNVPDWAARVGAFVRIEYASHDCPPVNAALVGLTNEQMDELLAQTERDLEATARRCQEIRAAFAAMLEASTRST